jgi:two-component system, NarL family, response regulator NreC
VSGLTVLLADDHTLMREGLRKILEERADWRVVAEASSGRDAVRLVSEHRPNVAVIDIGMPQLNGIDATRQITRHCPETNVLILSMYSNEAYVTQALHAGAKGYLLKDSAHSELIGAIALVGEGKTYFSPAIAKYMQHSHAQHLKARGLSDRYDLLSEREREIFQLIAEGQTNKEIADVLCVAISTVETHRSHIMEKLDVHSVAEIVLYAVRKGLIR